MKVSSIVEQTQKGDRLDSDLTDSDREMIQKLAERVLKLGLSVPAVLFLEMGKPLSYISSQTMVFFAPIATALFPGDGYGRLAKLLENRDNIERLMQEIERLEDNRQIKEKANPKEKPRRRWFGWGGSGQDGKE